MKKMIALCVLTLAALAAAPSTSSAQPWREEEMAYRMRRERRVIEQARYEAERREYQRLYAERRLEREYQLLQNEYRNTAEYFDGGIGYGYGGSGIGVWESWPRYDFPGYGNLHRYPYDYPYGGTSYRGSWGRVVQGGQYFDALVVPCRILSGRQRAQKFAAKIVGGVVGGAILDRNNRERGALLGGAAGAAWALADDSNFCSPPKQVLLPIDPAGGGSTSTSGSGQQPIARASSSSALTADPLDPLANASWSMVNTTDFRAVVTDPNTGEKKSIPVGGSINLPSPVGDQPYTVVLLVPGRGSVDKVQGEVRPSEDLSGWEIVAR